MVFRLRASRFVAFLMATSLSACAAVWGFEDGTLMAVDDAASTPGSSSGVGADGGPLDDAALTDAGIDLDAVSDAAPPGCAERRIDPDGYFVDWSTGDDEGPCGGQGSPCKTLRRALELYDPGVQATPIIYVGLGTYVGDLAMPVGMRGRDVSIQGDWFVRNNGGSKQWAPYCGGEASTVVQGSGEHTAAFTVKSELPLTAPEADAGDDAEAPAPAFDLRLSYLRIESAPSAPGTSRAALYVHGARLALEDVTLRASDGGRGLDGPQGARGANGGDSCPRGDGVAGQPGPSGTAPGPGMFDVDGWREGDPPLTSALDGVAGGAASNGCSVLLVDPARFGCGGAGGVAGTAGQLGGASTALYSWSSHVELQRTLLISGNGGAGGNGGGGGDGGNGGAAGGLIGSCPSRGAAGGRGGTGSPGSGGASHCVVDGAASTLIGFSDDLCSHGNAGEGGAGGLSEGVEVKGAPGTAGPRYTVEVDPIDDAGGE